MNRGRSEELCEFQKRRRVEGQAHFSSGVQAKLTDFKRNGNSYSKGNAVLIRSTIPDTPALPMKTSASGLRLPGETPARSQTEFKMPAPRTNNTTRYGEGSSNDDDDFRKPVKTAYNPFSAKPKSSPFNKPKKAVRTKQATGDEVLHQIDDSLDVEMDEFRPRKNNTFKLPQKMTEQQLKEKEEVLRNTEKAINTIKRAEHQFKFEADKVNCLFCREILHPMNDTIKTALEQIKERDQKYKEQQIEQLEKENAHSSFINRFQMVQKRPVSTREKETFCGLHKIELVIKPDGEDRGYPASIDFDHLEHRMLKFDQELKHVICKKIHSDYREIAETAYREQGALKARSAASVMNRFQHSLPGYYGPKGAAVILSVLTKLYLNTGYLKKHLVSPQLPLEFLQQVLVPEAGFRLIRQDITNPKNVVPGLTEKAKEMMLESIDYGSAIFPIDGNDSDSDTTRNHEPEIVADDLITTKIPHELSLDDDSDEVLY